MGLLRKRLNTVASRFRRRDWWRNVALVFLLVGLAGGCLLWLQVSAAWFHQHSGVALACVAIFGVVAVSAAAPFRFLDQHWIARRVETHYPDLKQRLVTTLDELDRDTEKPLGYLQHTVLQETLTHSQHNPWRQVVSPRSLRRTRFAALLALALLVASVVGLMRWHPAADLAQTVMPEGGIPLANFDLIVEPGDTEIEKGSNLTVVARFGKYVPKEAELVVIDRRGEQLLPMSRSLEDPIFGITVPDVARPLQYGVRHNGQQTQMYRVGIFTYPALLRADALLAYPQYTGMSEKRVQDTRRVSAVEGTQLTWQLHLNKPVAVAVLAPDDEGEAIPLAPDAQNPHTYTAVIELKKTTAWRLKLEDADGRGNRTPPKLMAKVLPNQPPELKLELARDASVSPLEEFLVKATVSDDYGLRRFGLTYTLAAASPTEIILGETTNRREKRPADHLLDFESMAAEPDQLLSYYFWAEDQDASGRPRRTLSDMYFAEVRHFEEIFRQGQQPPAGQQQGQQPQQSQNARDAEQLAELQKQIINATWKLIRRETAEAVTPVFAEDVAVIVESQQTAIDQVQQLAQQLSDSESQQHMLDVRREMQTSLRELANAFSESTTQPLTPAMQAQRAAYQALLKLRAREHEVVQSQSSSSSSSSRSASRSRFQQQLQQLKLDNEQNRYETQRQAQEQEDQQQTELRQALSRLRELARRQEDLNKQLKELQTALEQAETEQEREEIQRQLKRLRDQQQEMLRDTDELMDRLDESQNQETLQDTRDQLEDTREQLRDSAESLQRGEVTPALASGTRAQRELEEMREELRRESANQFNQRMRQMREQARQLEDDQEELGRNLADQAATTEDRPGLRREAADDEQLGDKLRQQNDRLNQLLQEIEDTVQQAEEGEPLLAEHLFDAFQEIKQDRVERNLDIAAELADRGLNQQAQQLEAEARQGITNLRENIERAAETVLGDETEALRTALRMLDELAQELNDEIQQFDPEGTPKQNRGEQTGPAARRAQDQDEPEEMEQDRDPQNQNPSDRRQDANSQDSSDRSQQPGQSRRQGSSPDRQNESESSSEPGERSDSQQPGQNPSSSPTASDPQQNQGQAGRGGSSETENQPPRSPSDAADRSQRDRQGSASLRSLRPRSLAGQQTDSGGTTGGAQDSLGSAPLTGDDFRRWSDRLRDIEEIVDDPDLRADAAQIRDRAKGFRLEFKRQSKEPRWSLVREMVSQPLRELRQRVSQELLRRSADRNALVPIDRDPVPDQFGEHVRLYYENLGSGE